MICCIEIAYICTTCISRIDSFITNHKSVVIYNTIVIKQYKSIIQTTIKQCALVFNMITTCTYANKNLVTKCNTRAQHCIKISYCAKLSYIFFQVPFFLLTRLYKIRYTDGFKVNI